MFQTSFNSLRKSKHHVFFGFVSEPPLVQWGVYHHPKGSNQHFFRCIVFPIENGGNSSHSMLVYQTVPELSIVSAQVPLAPHGLTWYASPNCLSGCDLMGADCRNCWWFRNLASKKTVEMGKKWIWTYCPLSFIEFLSTHHDGSCANFYLFAPH